MAEKNTNTKFTVIVRDEEFTLRRTQLDFDAPNYFTTYFYGDFAEAEAGVTTLTLDRSPDLFAVIVEYLSGYHILPLAQKAIPRTMSMKTAMLNLVEDAAFYGLTRLHTLLTSPSSPKIDFGWTGFSNRVITFEDVLNSNLPESVNYSTSGLCSFDGGSGKPVIIFARNMPIKLVGNLELDKSGRPEYSIATAFYHLSLTPETKAQLQMQPYSAFEFAESDPESLVVSVFPESRLHIDGSTCRFEHFAQWWRERRVFAAAHTGDELEKRVVNMFDEAFPRPFEEIPRRDDWDRNEFVLWGDELLFIIAARGFIAGTLQLHVKLLDVRARTRATVLESLRPPFLAVSEE